MQTINQDENKREEVKQTIELQIDPDLHEFSYEGRKFFVRLNQFVSSSPTTRADCLAGWSLERRATHPRVFEEAVSRRLDVLFGRLSNTLLRDGHARDGLQVR